MTLYSSASRPSLILAVTLAALTGCNADGSVRPLANEPALSKGGGAGKGGGGSVTVISASPSYGHRGDQHLIVQVAGSGFTTTSVAAWERNGAPDLKIHVNSTTFVSASQVTADITIADDAELASYNVSVTSGSKKGVGSELFTVTTAFLIPEVGGGPPGASDQAWDINDAGQVVGRSNATAFYWDPSTGTVDLGGAQAFAIDEAGGTVVGVAGSRNDINQPLIWTGGSANWSASAPPACNAGNVIGGVARGISRNGQLVAGHVIVSVSKKSQPSLPVLWDLPASTCRQLALPPAPFNSDGRVFAVNDLGMAAGFAADSRQNLRPVFWASNGAPTVLAPLPGDASAKANAMDASGTLVVGESDAKAVYWYFNGTTWSGATALASSCTSRANAVSDNGLIVGLGCAGASTWQVTGGAAGPESNLLKGGEVLGVNDNTDSGLAWAAGAGLGGAVYWKRP